MNRNSGNNQKNILDKTLEPQISPPEHYSMVKIEIVTSGGISSHHLFISKHKDNRIKYVLGRAANCDIVIS